MGITVFWRVLGSRRYLWFVWSLLFQVVLVAPTGVDATVKSPLGTIRRLPQHRAVAAACPRQYVSFDASSLACPKAQGLTILPASYPPRTVLIGYTPDAAFLEVLYTLIDRNSKRPRPLYIVVLIPRHDAEQAYQDLKPFIQRAEGDHLIVLTTPSDETLWMQDYMEIGISMVDGQAKIIDLPYTDREGEVIPAAIALSCQLDLVSQAAADTQNVVPDSGDYGGNIEALPGNLLVIGNTMTQGTRRRLREILPDMRLVEINTAWLHTAHVDELFAVLPHHAPQAACPFAMAYASPKLALEIIHQHGIQPERDQIGPETLSEERVTSELPDGAFFSTCLSASARFQPLSPKCQRFIAANHHYNDLIERERRRIDRLLRARHACPSPTWIALPQLFVPSVAVWQSEAPWGSEEDHAQALNPNVVNVIALGEDLLIPQQPYRPFSQAIARQLRPLGTTLVPVDATFSHFLNGGLHCNTSVIRTCRPALSHLPTAAFGGVTKRSKARKHGAR
jgi:hypothetical protein